MIREQKRRYPKKLSWQELRDLGVTDHPDELEEEILSVDDVSDCEWYVRLVKDYPSHVAHEMKKDGVYHVEKLHANWKGIDQFEIRSHVTRQLCTVHAEYCKMLTQPEVKKYKEFEKLKAWAAKFHKRINLDD